MTSIAISTRIRVNWFTLVSTPVGMLAFALIPLQWIMLTTSIKASDVGFLLLAMLLAIHLVHRKKGLGVSFFRSPILWGAIPCFLVYLALTIVSATYSNAPMSGLSNVVREFAYLLLAFLVGLSLRDSSLEKICRVLAAGLSISLVSVVLVAYFQFRSHGIDLIQTFVSAVTSGGTYAVASTVFKQLFNQHALSLTSVTEFASSARHTIMYLFVVGAMTSLILAEMAEDSRTRFFRRAMAACFGMIVLASFSKQTILVLFVFVAALSIRWPLWTKIVLGTIALLGVYLVLHSAANATLQAQIVEGVLNNPRIGRYQEALKDILAAPILGQGAGTLVDGAYYVDDFVLSAWQQSGIFAALASVGCLTFISLVAGRSFLKYLWGHRSERWMGAIILGFTTLIVVRMLVGQRGSLEPGSASALGLTMALSSQSPMGSAIRRRITKRRKA